jgi:hypothetical protein
MADNSKYHSFPEQSQADRLISKKSNEDLPSLDDVRCGAWIPMIVIFCSSNLLEQQFVETAVYI